MKAVSLDDLRLLGRTSEASKVKYTLHEHGDSIQRFFNVLKAETAVVPHRHPSLSSVQTFVVLSGKLGVFTFNDKGSVLDALLLDEKRPAVDIKGDVWHSVLSFNEECIYFEVKKGGLEPDKEIPDWAPATRNEMEDFRKRIVSFLNLKKYD